mmetsp:Transcript_4221/g.9464  ORF Transcript_4221/g.9464 Transcript_4221/m.9464 type:complete len:259 (+) Transcript_4221:204-980(+)
MGAAASVKLLYTDASAWFTQYFDGVQYIEDFRALDKNADGGISFEELQAWLIDKATCDSSWKMMLSNTSIFEMAHTLTSKKMEATLKPRAIQGVENFKSFLVHLFVLSILWVHFKHADNWEGGMDVGNEALTYDEFKMACRTFISAQANEELTEKKVAADFQLLDVDKSGTVDFNEVCVYCAQFLDTEFGDMFVTEKTAASSMTIAHGHGHEGLSEKTHLRENSAGAMDLVMKQMAKNENIAAFEEIKVNTEIMLGLF